MCVVSCARFALIPVRAVVQCTGSTCGGFWSASRNDTVFFQPAVSLPAQAGCEALLNADIAMPVLRLTNYTVRKTQMLYVVGRLLDFPESAVLVSIHR